MHDPDEGMSSTGLIVTGVRRDRVSPVFEPVLSAAVASIDEAARGASVYVYGSVATGQAKPGLSDVDLLTIGVPPDVAAAIGADLSGRFRDVARDVALAPATEADFAGDSDEAYGGMVFLRHYCAHVAGPDRHSHLPAFAADDRAARGFNGDIATHAIRWRRQLENGDDTTALGRRVARKTLFAVAGLVSVHDRTWTTDRALSARRWAEITPAMATDLSLLLQWSIGSETADRLSLGVALSGIVARIVDAFAESIGLWTPSPPVS